MYDIESIRNSKSPINISADYSEDGTKRITINKKVPKNYTINPEKIEGWKSQVSNSTPYVTPGRGMHFTLEQYLNAGQEHYTADQLDSTSLKNATNLINKVNALGELVDYHNIITSGYRSRERQIEIYRQKGEKPALGSKHLSGHALDIYDPNGELKEKLLNTAVLDRARDLGLYFENFNSTPNWVHIQDEAPARTGGQIWSADDLMKRV